MREGKEIDGSPQLSEGYPVSLQEPLLEQAVDLAGDDRGAPPLELHQVTLAHHSERMDPGEEHGFRWIHRLGREVRGSFILCHE